MIEAISLANWRSHERSEFRFNAGTNLIMGSMGAGKSSLLDAISFALFGTFPALERRKLKLENVLRHGQPSGGVDLVLRWNGNRYRIERRLEQDKGGARSEATVYKDDSMLDSGPMAVTQYVEQLLGIDYGLFARAIYSEQNNIDYFLNLDPRRRKQEMDALLGLDKFETVRAGAVSILNRLKAERKLLEDRFEPARFEETLRRLEEMEGQRKRLEEAIRNQERVLGEIEAGVQGAEKRYAFLRKRFEEGETVRQNILRLESRLAEARRQMQPLDEKAVETARQQKGQLEAERPHLLRKRKELEEKLQRLQTLKAKAEMERREAEQRRLLLGQHQERFRQLGQGKPPAQWQEELGGLQQSQVEGQAKEKAVLQEIADLQEWQERLRPGMGVCPLCERPLDQESIRHVQEERRQRLLERTQRLDEIRKRLATEGPSLSELRERLGRLQIAQKLVEEQERLLAALPREAGKDEALGQALEACIREKQAFDEEAIEKSGMYERVLAQLREIKRIGRLEQEVGQAIKELERERARAKEAVMEPETIETARAGLEEMRLKLERQRAELRSLQMQQKGLQEASGLLGKERERLEGWRSEIAAGLELEEQMARYRQAVLETQVLLRSGLVEAINAALTEVWKIFYPYGNYQGLRLRADEKDYVLEVLEEGWKPLEGIASGGERSCAALTLRVALATVLTPTLSWLILDEPTHNLDKNAVELLSQTLQFKVPEVVKQTFVITHEEALMGSDFAASYRLERQKEGSGITKVERV